MLHPFGAIVVALLAATLAEPPQLNGRSPSPAAGAANTDSAEVLLQHPEVQKELNLGKEQLQKIDQIVRTLREKQQLEVDRLRDLSPSEHRRQQADLAKTYVQEIQTRVRDVLEAKQARRLEQIRRQRQGLRAFADPEVEDASPHRRAKEQAQDNQHRCVQGSTHAVSHPRAE